MIVTALENGGLRNVHVLQAGGRYQDLASRRWMLRLWKTSYKVWLAKRRIYATRCLLASTVNKTNEKSV